MTLIAKLDLLATQVDGRLVAVASEAERVVLFDAASRLGVEQFVGVFRGREEANPRQVDTESVDRRVVLSVRKRFFLSACDRNSAGNTQGGKPPEQVATDRRPVELAV